ncbi:MAG: hypothetical protein IID40_06085 [Planctomycetes bacterium]|nr:hypothetical protein [Planctomycetota bacterium]
MEVDTDKASYQIGDRIVLRIAVTASSSEGTVKIPDDASPTPPLDLALRIRHAQTGAELAMRPSADKDRPSGWKSAALAEGQSAGATYLLRELYTLPWPETGDYTIEAQWQGQTSPSFRFRITPPRDSLFEQTLDAPLDPPVQGVDTIHYSFWVVRGPKENPRYKLVYQRVDSIAHEAQVIAKLQGPAKPLIVLRAKPDGWHRRVFVAWADGGQMHYIDLRSDRQLQYETKTIELEQAGDIQLSGQLDSASNQITLTVTSKTESGDGTGTVRVFDIGANGQLVEAP